MYGFVEVSSDMMSLDRSLARSGEMKHAREESATPESYMFWEFRSLRIMFVVNMRTWEKTELFEY